MISPQGCASREKPKSLMKSIPCYISWVEIANVMQCERNPPTSFSTLSLNRRVSVSPRYFLPFLLSSRPLSLSSTKASTHA